MKICLQIYSTNCKRSHVAFVWFIKAHFKIDHIQTVKSIFQIERDSPDDNVGVHVCPLIPGLMNS